jgi:DNA topoisomerase-1
MVELIITEKPSAAKKVADALDNSRPIKKGDKGVPYYEVTHGNKDIIVASAVGHLYGLAEKEKKGFHYPVFDIEWVPTSDVNKESAFSKKYLELLKRLAKTADIITVATDYDVEGEVIGLNVVRFACKRKDARRMKFSTLTKEDLVKAYENASPTLDWGQAEAGETRHVLDYYYGINLSRALTTAMKASGMFKILSTGRVQGPALKTIVEREKEIRAFQPVPFWQIELKALAQQVIVSALHIENKFWDKLKADQVFAKVKDCKTTIVENTENAQFEQHAPSPFDLTTLQTESYRCFGIAPKTTLEIAQELYTNGYISYPRTSSQQLPPSLGFHNLLKQLAKQPKYSELAGSLAKKKDLAPHNGKKTDPAHPAIYPTGIAPRKLEDRTGKVYDLIVKRFMATFAESAIRETVTVTLNANQELFIAKGTTTIKTGWHTYYVPYVPFEEEELPKMDKGMTLPVKEILLHTKETQPPRRYTEASIIKELEKRELGTKSTRAQIIDTLYQRNYVKGKAIEATELGIHLIAVLEEHAPKIVDEELTRHFELEMEEIREHKKKGDVILAEAKTILTELLADFKKKEVEIGQGLQSTFKETRMIMTLVGKCPNCKDGHLVLRKGKFGRFIACDTYPACNTTYKLPSNGLVEVTTSVCEHCGFPVVRIIRKGKRPQEVCINPGCPSKVGDSALFKEHPCPKCGEGTVILRRSIYGAFGACNKFPKCRYLERIGKPAPKLSSAEKVAEQVAAAPPSKPSKPARKPRVKKAK